MAERRRRQSFEGNDNQRNRGTRQGGGERSAEVLRARMSERISAEPLARVDYLSVADGASLAELSRLDGPALLGVESLQDRRGLQARGSSRRTGRICRGGGARKVSDAG